MADWGSSLIPFTKLSLVVDGGSTGLLTVPTTFDLRIGSVVYLSATGLQTKTLQIADIASDTTVFVKTMDTGVYTRFDCSAYTVVLGATLVQPEQTNFYVNKEPGIADVYRMLRDMRDMTGIKQGAPNSLANAWPIKITDGVSVLGTALNPVWVTGISGGGGGGGGTASAIGGAFPAIATAAGFNDGAGLMQGARLFDLDSGAGAEYDLGVSLRLAANGGSVPFGTSANPIRVDVTGTTTQPVSFGSLPLPTGAATELTLATINTKFNSLGQKNAANSMPVIIATDQTSIPTQIQASSTGGWYPAPQGQWEDNTYGKVTPLLTDVQGNLQTRGAVTSDAGSFRDDFSQWIKTYAGTVTFTNGSTTVTGVGTNFIADVDRGDIIKLSSDADSAYVQIARVLDAQTLTLSTPYTGTGGTGTVAYTYWIPVTGAGATITNSSSLLQITSGTGVGQNTFVKRYGDWGPMTGRFRLKVDTRQNNQTTRFGFMDDWYAPNVMAAVEFTGTSTNQLTFITRSSSSASDVATTTVTAQQGQTSDVFNSLVIEIDVDQCALYYDPSNGDPLIRLAYHKDHIPNAYKSMDLYFGISNSATVTNATLQVDSVTFDNFDFNAIKTMAQSTPGKTFVLGADSVSNGVFNANNATVAIALAGYNGASFQASAGTFTGTIVPELSFDNINWFTTFFQDPTTNALSSSLSLTNPNPFSPKEILLVGGVGYARVRVSSFTSGSCPVQLRTSVFVSESDLSEQAVNSTSQPPSANQIAGWDGTTLRVPSVKAASAAAIATDQALVVAISPNNTVSTNAVKSSTPAVTQVASSATNVTLKTSNTSRLGLTIYNDSSQVLYVKLGATASSTSYTVKMGPSSYYELPSGYTGQIDGIWASANGSALITELT